mmetsp:Transcript_116886/g.325737  ORF Transcript_116886/g.325737 Transcript_116886/m.325737 type:complete len:248 (-) Transcript_116886:32-775(-)
MCFPTHRARKRREEAELRWVRRPPENAPTIIIFNWDDTLFCTSSFIFEDAQRLAVLPLFVAEYRHTERHLALPVSPRLLQQMEETVCHLITEAVRMGPTFIVTNSSRRWVVTTAQVYLPGLLPLLEQVTIVSARTAYEKRFPQEIRRWKQEAFLKIARETGSQHCKDLLVIGNSDLEMRAADMVESMFTDWRIKVVKLRRRPSAQDLLMEHRLVLDNLAVFKESDRSLTITLERSKRPTISSNVRSS